ncbi:MAG: PAS domain-containing sensor histidine kinase [bacterium]
MQSGIIVLSESAEVAFWNKGAESITGIQNSEVAGQDVWSSFVLDLEQSNSKKLFENKKMFLKELGSKEEINFEAFYYHKKYMRRLCLRLTIFPYWEIKDVLKGSIVVFQDATKDQETQALQDKWRSMVVHDLKSPLTSIMGSNQILRKSKNISVRSKRLLRLSDEASREILDLVNMYLDISKINASMYSVKKANLKLKPLVKRCVRRHKYIQDKKNIRIDIFVDEKLKIKTDIQLLGRVLGNLIDNAIKYTHKGGKVSVFVVHETADKTLFSVSDNGCGIERKYLPHIFDRFFQVEFKNRALHQGVGLGLYFCRLAVDTLGGSIWVNSKKNQGTTFSFILPDK